MFKRLRTVLSGFFSSQKEENRKEFPETIQEDATHCGPVCLQMICEYFGKKIDLSWLLEFCETGRSGTTLLALSDTAEMLGFEAFGVQIPIKTIYEIPLPAILHFRNCTFVVLYKIEGNTFWIVDPEIGKLKMPIRAFAGNWLKEKEEEGIALILQPTTTFFKK